MDYMKWLKAMKAAGYARSTSWVSEVDRMIKRYNLTRFDRKESGTVIPKLQIRDTIPVLVR
jgi:flagellum-specific peptidoglycan hydrolase FlgJ